MRITDFQTPPRVNSKTEQCLPKELPKAAPVGLELFEIKKSL